MCCLLCMQMAQVTERAQTDILAGKKLNWLMVTCSQKLSLYLGPWSPILPHCLMWEFPQTALDCFQYLDGLIQLTITPNLLFYPPWHSQLLVRARDLIRNIWILVVWYSCLLVNWKKRAPPKMFAAIFDKCVAEINSNSPFFPVISCAQGKFSVRQSVLPEAVGSLAASLSCWGERNKFSKSDYPLVGWKIGFIGCFFHSFSQREKEVCKVAALNT